MSGNNVEISVDTLLSLATKSDIKTINDSINRIFEKLDAVSKEKVIRDKELDLKLSQLDNYIDNRPSDNCAEYIEVQVKKSLIAHKKDLVDEHRLFHEQNKVNQKKNISWFISIIGGTLGIVTTFIVLFVEKIKLLFQ